MNDFSYFLIAKIISLFYGKGTLSVTENLPESSPAVFVANHLGAQGPIGVECSIHLRFYPWIVADMLDRDLAPEYLRIDFVEPAMKLKPPWSLMVARAISLISVPLLYALSCIPIRREKYADCQDGLHRSLSLLMEGKIVLVLPEDPALELNPQINMRPFMKGFSRLGELFYDATGTILTFYPTAIHESKEIVVGTPVRF